MTVIRALLRRHPALALLLVAAALLSKALVPAGYMTGQSSSRTFDIIVCADGLGAPMAKQIVIQFDDDGSDQGKHRGKGECAFTALGHGSIASADPALLVAALLFLITLGFTAAPALPLRRPSYLRPPLRGPPAIA